jgi:uncharacterized protein (TIGR02391 family)
VTDRPVDPVNIGRYLGSELAEYARPKEASPGKAPPTEPEALAPANALLAEYDRRILDEDLRGATRSRFVSGHYADAVEAGVKALAECVRTLSRRDDDGDPLMTGAFRPNGPALRINRLSTQTDISEQRGHMMLCQGVVAAWRNPRAHSLVEDAPERALMMLEVIGDLIRVTKAATRTRRRRT